MKAIRSIAICLVLLPAPLFAQWAPGPDRLERISDWIQAIKSATDEHAQDLAAYELIPTGGELTLSEIRRAPDGLIADLASLLNSKNGTVVFHAALTLRLFHIRALPAVPALRQALAEFRRSEEARIASSPDFPLGLRHGTSVGDAVCLALGAIGAPYDHRNCFNGDFIYPGDRGPSPEMLRWSQFIRR